MSENTRPTKTVTTPSGATAEVYTYITARERLAATKALGTTNGEGITVEGAEAGQKALIEALVASYEESRENVYSRLLDAQASDFDAVMREVNEAVSPEKKTS